MISMDIIMIMVSMAIIMIMISMAIIKYLFIQNTEMLGKHFPYCGIENYACM